MRKTFKLVLSSFVGAAFCLQGLAAAKIVSSKVTLNEELSLAEAVVKIEGFEKGERVRIRLLVERDSRSCPVYGDGEYRLSTPLRDPAGFAAGKDMYKPSVTLVKDDKRRYDESSDPLERARVHFLEPNGPARDKDSWEKSCDKWYRFPVFDYPTYTGKPEWVMPVGAGELSAMVSWGVDDLHLNLSKTDYILRNNPSAKFQHQVGMGSPVSPGHITVRFKSLKMNDIVSFDQSMDVKRGRITIDVKTKKGDISIEIFGDRETGSLVGEIADMRSDSCRGAAVTYESLHRNDPTSRMFALSNGRIAFHENNDTEYYHSKRLGSYYVTEVSVTNAVAYANPTNSLAASLVIAKDKKWRFVVASASGRDSSSVKDAARAAGNKVAKASFEKLAADRDAWWARYWSKSWIDVKGDRRAQLIERLWYQQLYVWASVGCGKVPPKFNGGAGLVLGDSRSWGGGLWTQNTREMLWPLGAANHRLFMENFVRFYESARAAITRGSNRALPGIGGFKMPETISIETSSIVNKNQLPTEESLSAPYVPASKEDVAKWRAQRSKNKKPNNGPGICSSGTEILHQMVDYVRYYGDESFVPAVGAWLRSQAEMYLSLLEKGPDGKWHPYDTLENESWYCPEDCLVDICAARFCLALTVSLGKSFSFPANLIADAKDRLENLADIPTGEKFEMTHKDVSSRVKSFTPGDKLYVPFKAPPPGQPKGNVENNELYTVYPFTMGDYKKNVATFRQGADMVVYGWEPVGAGWGWYPVPMWAARLRLDDAADFVFKFAVGNNTWPFGGGRSPAAIMYKGAEVEDCPYLDSAGVLQAATQELFLQSHADEPSGDLFCGGPVRFVPGVPKEWSGAFKLLARGGFEVVCRFENGAPISAEILSLRGGEFKWVVPGSEEVKTRATKKGEKFTLAFK